jgi:putative restriction endonuclease
LPGLLAGRQDNDVATYGAIEGVLVGTEFPSRRALADAGVHRALQAGIVGNGREGAESVVVSGGYEDDEDHGDVIVYTGHGGNDRNTRRQVADQSFDAPGNSALLMSQLTGGQVRVVRGRNPDSPFAPPTGYRYDGIFRVDSFSHEQGKSGFRICRFRLVEVQNESQAVVGLPAEHASHVAPLGTSQPGRVPAQIQRIVRSGQVAEFVKRIHNHACQFCGTRLEINGRGYSEAAHIRAVGRPHDGPDEPSNVLCLCPNCHVLFDNGAVTVDDEFRVHGISESPKPLRIVPSHAVESAHLLYHRRVFS